MSNIVIPDGGNIGSASDTDAISIAANGKPTFSAGIANTGTIDAGTIGDNVVLSDKYFLHGKVYDNFTSDLPTHINFDESTAPYWAFTSDSDWHVSGTGSNFSKGSTISDLKIHRAGIYLVNFSATGYDATAERFFFVQIRGVGSGSSANLVSAYDNTPIAEAGNNFANASISLVHKFNANDQINLYVNSGDGNTLNLHNVTHFNICLIRPL